MIRIIYHWWEIFCRKGAAKNLAAVGVKFPSHKIYGPKKLGRFHHACSLQSLAALSQRLSFGTCCVYCSKKMCHNFSAWPFFSLTQSRGASRTRSLFAGRLLASAIVFFIELFN